MELAIQLASNEKTTRKETQRNLKDCNTQSLLAQSKRGEKLIA